MKPRRYILLLDPRYQEEEAIFNLIKAAPSREQASFARALMIMGYNEIKKDKARAAQLPGGLNEVSAT